MLNLEVGDTMEPFFYGDYWMKRAGIVRTASDKCPKMSAGNTLKRLLFIASTV